MCMCKANDIVRKTRKPVTSCDDTVCVLVHAF